MTVSEPEATPIGTPFSPEVNLQPETVLVIAPATLAEGSTFQAVVDGIQFTASVPRGGVRLGETFETMYPKMIKVLAPAFLNQGDRIEAEVDGIRFYATVPPGGVREGDFFEVLHPSVAPQPVATAAATTTDAGRNTHQWRTGLFDCCNTGQRDCCALCCMAFMCPWFLNAQIMQRMNLGFAGCPRGNATHASNKVCSLHVAIMVSPIALVIVGFFVNFLLVPAICILYIYLPLSFVAMICVRKSMRSHYGIPGSCCDDYCVTSCCGWCSLIQMANHTHDPKIHSYDCCSTTGLLADAPIIV